MLRAQHEAIKVKKRLILISGFFFHINLNSICFLILKFLIQTAPKITILYDSQDITLYHENTQAVLHIIVYCTLSYWIDHECPVPQKIAGDEKNAARILHIWIVKALLKT